MKFFVSCPLLNLPRRNRSSSWANRTSPAQYLHGCLQGTHRENRIRYIIPPPMFCPECRAEYRAGFTRCSDCDVDLVQELSESDTRVRKAKRETPSQSNLRTGRLARLLTG